MKKRNRERREGGGKQSFDNRYNDFSIAKKKKKPLLL
jgi:hypothetical protein